MQVVYLEGEENTTRGVDETREKRQPIKGETRVNSLTFKGHLVLVSAHL